MKFLRTASTRRLVSVLVGLLAVLLAGAAIAVAAAGSGPVPPRKALPQAIHDALSAGSVQGITARISFTNHLISSTDLGEGTSSPLLQGGSGRLWLDPAGHRLRLELQGDNGDAQLVVTGRSFWLYDPSGHTVYEGTLPADTHPSSVSADRVPSTATIASHVSQARRHLALSGAQPTDVAGQAAYRVTASPSRHPGLLGAVSLAWDALHGTPLQLAITARGSSSPVLELTATDISFGPVPASVFAIHPPSDAHVARVNLPSGNGHHGSLDQHGRVTTTGQGLDGIAVIRDRAPSAKPAAANGDRGGLTLPTVSVHGITAQELQTPLFTLIRFTRGGTTYTVIGSQPPAGLLAAARRL